MRFAMIVLPTPIDCAHTCRRVLAPTNGCYRVLIRPLDFTFEHAFVVAYMHVCTIVADDSGCVSIKSKALILDPFVDIQCDCMHMKLPCFVPAPSLARGLFAIEMH